MDPVTQTLAQQQSGSAGGQGFGQFFVAGRQDARQREQLNLARRQEDRLAERQRRLLPYEEAIMGMQVIDAGLTAHSNRLKLENQITSNKALPEILALENYFMESPQGFKDQAGIQAFKQLKDRYPQAFVEGGSGHKLMQLIQMPVITDWQMQRLEEADKRLKGTGRYVRSFDPKTGMPEMGVQNPPARPDKLEVADEMTSLQRIIASPNTPPALKQQAENQLANIQAQMGTSSMEVMDPQGNVIMRQTTGRQPTTTDGLTPANLTDVNKKLISTDIALHELDRLEQAVDKLPSGFGALGKGRELLETGKGMVGSTAPTPVSNVRNQAQVTFTQIADSLRVDSGNMSLYERRQLEKAGDITGIDVSAPQAKGKIRNVRNALIGAQLRRLQAAGRKPTDEHLRQLPATEFDDVYSSGLLTDEDARRWFKLHSDAEKLLNNQR